jgi:hypothetical protein
VLLEMDCYLNHALDSLVVLFREDL